MSVPVPAVTTDEIYKRYLEKAINEINDLGDEVGRAAATSCACPCSARAIRSPTSSC